MHEPDKNPILWTESRPSNYTGISWWLMVAYKEHEFEELLPYDWMSKPENVREEIMDLARQKLTLKLRPILLAEDGEHLSLVGGKTVDGVKYAEGIEPAEPGSDPEIAVMLHEK